ncbi:uncharacterized protein [Coffea arabica]|uniref:Reverse transcriptase RNase H-like domain-containing protein n=1 Tax=Coffea arabica TaxID=13443 RepID=A0ABM4VC73_COFAR
MKKRVPFEWDESCRNAFTSIKTYLMNPSVLAAPIPAKSLILYIFAQERSVGALLAQENDEGKENALYYLSRMMTSNELNYSPIEKLCLSLIFVIQKLKHYFQAHTIRIISKSNPIKYVMAKPILSDRLARWYLQFQQFEIIYVPAKTAKRQIVADFLADHPIPAEWELTDELLDEEVFMIESPWSMYFDGAAHRDGAAMSKFCEKFHFKQYNSSMYYAAANGLAEAFNKTLCNMLKKIVDKSKRDWYLRIGEAFWVYRTTFRTPTQATPYALVYGVEAVLPLECQIPSLRIAIQEGLSEEDNVRLRLEELEALDEKRLEAQQRIECYQARLLKAFNKHVRPRSFQIGELVLAVRRPIILTHGGQRKFTPKWDGPYVVREIYTNGSYKLVAEDGLRVGPINGKYLKMYYA